MRPRRCRCCGTGRKETDHVNHGVALPCGHLPGLRGLSGWAWQVLAACSPASICCVCALSEISGVCLQAPLLKQISPRSGCLGASCPVCKAWGSSNPQPYQGPTPGPGSGKTAALGGGSGVLGSGRTSASAEASSLGLRLLFHKTKEQKETRLLSQQSRWESLLGTVLDLFGKNMLVCPLG